jgi:hypothetical protein
MSKEIGVATKVRSSSPTAELDTETLSGFMREVDKERLREVGVDLRMERK